MKTLVIGRSPFADIVVADASVAPHHAEIVVTDDGRLYLTDCGSAGGTWRAGESPADAAGGAAWSPVRQAFVAADEPLRLGDHRCTAADLTSRIRADAPTHAHGAMPAGDGPERPRLRGRLERNPITGEIVRRRP
ncbi:MAG: FHA domain-containing protein [Rhodospirillales bacterium]